MIRRGILCRSAVAGLVLASASVLAGAGTAQAAPSDDRRPQRPHVRGAGESDTVPGRYIVVLKEDRVPAKKVKAAASALTAEHGGTVRKVFTSALNGYSAAMNRSQAARVAADPDVAYVEPVRTYSATDTQTTPPSWGLDRLDQAAPKLNGSYTYPNTGSAITAYVIDTGIDIAHEDFGGRASSGYDAVDGDDDAQDCDGHGTHVAGTIGGTKYGVAKQIHLVAVRVLDCEGYGTTEQVVAGIDWVTSHAAKPAVANMSLGGGSDLALNDAVARSVHSGITFAVAAGNEMADACTTSPGSVPEAITVGASDKIDFRAWFSNYGSCVDAFAPGVSIVSAAAGTGNGNVAYSGTSMASPHVAGVAALVLQAHPTWTPAQVRDALVTGGVAGAVHDNQGSLDRLVTVATLSNARSAHGLKARSNGNYVSAEAGGTKPLTARSAALGGWEKFDIVEAGSGYVALRAKANNKYVTAVSGGTKPLLAQATAIAGWEKFQLTNNTDGTISLKSLANNKYVTAPKTTTSPLIAGATSVGGWEKFDVDAPAPVVTLRSRVSKKYVSAANAGNNPLIPVATTAGGWEKFEVIDRKFSYFSLRALVNGKYVSSESNGTKPLRASATSIGAAEEYDFLAYNQDGSLYLQAYVDDQAITAGSAGTSQLTSSKTIDWNSETLGLGAGEGFFIDPA